MKKLLSLLLCAILLLPAAFAVPFQAGAETSVPQEVLGTLPKNSLLLDAVTVPDSGSGVPGIFVLTRNEKNVNELSLYRQKSGKWSREFITSAAVPQTSHDVYLSYTETGAEWPGDRPITAPQLSLLQLDSEKEYPELCITFQLEKGCWMLHRVWSYTGYQSMLIRDRQISYYENIESDRVSGTVKGDFQRDLRWFSLSALPKTLKEARTKITSAPELPFSSELKAQDVKFSGGQKYEVYSAPDKSSLRGGNGKAKVSTNGWIQVFGKENGYLLIQYSVDKDHYRFGYISEKALPKKTTVPDLGFDRQTVYAKNAVNITDDPLYSRGILASLPEGASVTLLARLGNDAYIEWSKGKELLRGFVPADALIPAAPDFASYTDASGNVYPWFVITKMNTDPYHRVLSVTGHFERMIFDPEYECEASEAAPGSERTFILAPDFSASMIGSMVDPASSLLPVTDLYRWYLSAYLGRNTDDGRELVYTADLSEEQLNSVSPDFWFFTTQITLNSFNEIQTMEYVYVPWG